jgi:predicted nucleotidyltransferase
METAAVERVARSHGIRLMLRFGSTVDGRTHPRSDVDVGVVLERPRLSLDEYASLTHDLQQLFPGQELDLAILNRADPLFLKKVLERCELLHGQPGELQRLRLYAFRRYQDHRRYLELERAFVSRTLGALTSRG